ncbi:hypothetical protein Sps_04405 [Shewanella psychrophila]|uniref:Uncharacterized protein n=1 Tax=Shewanella psychrophila TaxID=225848 RepID=A0A1S6HVF0_9GAMM|nr:hypothetical protein [Shewanella psychrophila]AQS39491.1 hypothetical protein Sps_04405 [Shewanella psychrophila]
MKPSEKQLSNMVSTLPQELSPQEELWGKIEGRLNAPLTETKHKWQHKHWSLLAIASVMVFAVLIGTRLSALSVTEVNISLLDTLTKIHLDHEKQLAHLEQVNRLVNWQSSPYSSPVETGIEQLRQAAKQIYQTLRQNPRDKQLWQLWLWTQHREIELLKQGQKLPVSQNSSGEII